MNTDLQVEFSFVKQPTAEVVEKVYTILKSTQESCKDPTLPESFISQVDNAQYINDIKTKAVQLRMHNPALIVVIGIGGSSLGVQALYQVYKEIQSLVPILWLETIDPDFLAHAYQEIESVLNQDKSVIACIITKSGTTLETLMNAALVLERYKDYSTFHICAVTVSDSPLAQKAQEESWDLVSIPASVGGRFSVFTAVGLLPLLLAGADIDELVRGIQEYTPCYLQVEDVMKNDAAMIAAIIYEYYQKGFLIHDFFYFCTSLMSLGLWARQLFAESLGKQSIHTQVPVGIMPTVTIGTQDLHSMYQLYMTGPHKRLTSFVTISSWKHDFTIPTQQFKKQLDYLEGRSTSYVLSAIEQGVKRTYEQRECPYYAIKWKTLSMRALGSYMQLYMIATVYIGRLLDIDPFDQPHVELYKQQTQEILSR